MPQSPAFADTPGTVGLLIVACVVASIVISVAFLICTLPVKSSPPVQRQTAMAIAAVKPEGFWLRHAMVGLRDLGCAGSPLSFELPVQNTTSAQHGQMSQRGEIGRAGARASGDRP